MKRILLVETASPRRVLHTVRQILDTDLHSQPDICVLCRESSRSVFAKQAGLTIIPCADPSEPSFIKKINSNGFDVLYAFWTGEKDYRRMKLLALRLKATERRLIAG